VVCRGAAAALPWLATLDLAAVDALRLGCRLTAHEARLAATGLGDRRGGSARRG